VVFHQFINDAIGITYAACNETFKCTIFWMFTNPYYWVQVFLIIFLPVLTNKLIPLLKHTYIICKLLIFCPTIHNLNRIQGFREKLYKSIYQLFLCWFQINVFRTSMLRISISYWSLGIV
jgi:hypothetical protein